MQIAELRRGMRKVDVIGKIVYMDFPFKRGLIASAILQDESGSIKLTLWNENISELEVGDKVSISNAYVNSFRGELQLNVGRYAKLTIA